MAKTLGELIKGFNRPPSRPVQKDAYEEEADRRKMMSGMDVEFRADLDPVLRDDPLSRLGYGGGVKFIDEEGFDGAWHIPNSYPVPLQAELTQGNLGAPVGRTDVAYTADYGGSPEVIAHEMRHRGLDRVYDMYIKDPDAFANEYGIETAMYIEQIGQDRATNEAFTEVGDVPHEHKEWLDADGVDQKRRKLSETFSTPRDYLDNEQVRNAYKQLQRAAQDSLRAAGEPPRTIPKEVEEEGQGWFRGLIEKIGFAEGGLTPNQQRRAGYGGRAVAPVDEQMMSLGFSAPMSAGPGDVDWGVRDELGRPVRETVLGQQYSVREQTPQETTTLKEDVGRFVGTLGEWKSKGYPLPSSSQVVDAAKNVAVSIADSAERVARSEGTVGEAMSFAATPISAASTARVPAGALTSGAAKRAPGGAPGTDNPKYNPLFRDTDRPTDERMWAEASIPNAFYSPILNSVDNFDFGKQGLKGETIEAMLKKRAPKIRSSELVAADIPWEKNKRYTKEEALKLVEDNTWKVDVHYEDMYSSFQRQPVSDREVAYKEMILEARKPGASFEYRPDRSHYGPQTIAHTRYSIREGSDGDYLLVEELQSDLAQSRTDDIFGTGERKTGAKDKKPEPQFADKEEYLAHLKETTTQRVLENLPEGWDKEQAKLFVDAQIDYAAEGIKKKPIFSNKEYYNRITNFGSSTEAKSYFQRYLPSYRELQEDIKEQTSPARKEPPVKTTGDWVRPLMTQLIREAQEAGVDKIRVPDAESIAAVREGVEAKGLKATYEDAVKKVVNDIIREEGDVISIQRGSKPRVKADIDEADIEFIEQTFPDGIYYTDDDTWTLKDEIMDAYNRDGPEGVSALAKSAGDRLASITLNQDFLDDPFSSDAMQAAQSARHQGEQMIRDYADFLDLETTAGNSPINYLEIDISNMPDITGKQQRFAEGGVVEDKLSPESFKRYLSGYAEGGMTMKNMANGGMADSGQDMHPNGNEVPPGSLPQEVADDIDIKVSGGEYIVPADVTQYYGVKFFEDLRERAKQGLMQMEQRGRIGGQPAPGARPQPMADEDDLPFSEDELMVEEAGERGFAEGGSTYTPTFTASAGSRPNMGSSRFGNTMSTGGIDVRTYEDAEGNKKRITFVNGRPLQQIPAGFYPEGQVPAQAKTGTGSTENLQGEGDLEKAFIDREGLNREAISEVEKWHPDDVPEDQLEDWVKSQSMQGKMMRAGGVLAGNFLGPAGMLLAGAANVAMTGKNRKMYSKLEYMKEQAIEAGNRDMYDYYNGLMEDLEDNLGGMAGEWLGGDWKYEPKEEVGTAGGTTAGAATRSGAGSTAPATGSNFYDDWQDSTSISSQPMSAGADSYDWGGTGEGDTSGGPGGSWGGADDYNSGSVSQSGVSESDTSQVTSSSGGYGDAGSNLSGSGWSAGQDADYGYQKGGLVKKRAKFKSSRKK